VNKKQQLFFHIHLVSDATGETLDTVARATTACFNNHEAIQHAYSLVRTSKQLERVFVEIEKQPGIVLFTMIDEPLRRELENHCARIGVPTVSILDPVITTLTSYLNVKSQPVIGGQHNLNDNYFRRIDALNFTMVHDDGQHVQDLENADIVLIGISRTSKTPTSIYLANRGVKVANIPLVPEVKIPPQLENLKNPLVVGLIASVERISQIRRHRLDTLNEFMPTLYSDRASIAKELNFMKKLCSGHNWPVLDVTRRSIEETAAAILNLFNEKKNNLEPARVFNA